MVDNPETKEQTVKTIMEVQREAETQESKRVESSIRSQISDKEKLE